MTGARRGFLHIAGDFLALLGQLTAIFAIVKLLSVYLIFPVLSAGGQHTHFFHAHAAMIESSLSLLAMLRWRLRAISVERRFAAPATAERPQCYDSLTGLRGRASFLDYLESAEDAPTVGAETAILIIGLERIRSINDAYGYDAGDHVLATIAQRIRRLVEPRGTVGRTGGNEFACVIQHAARSDTPASLAKDLLAAISAPIAVRGGMLTVHAAIGIAQCFAGAHASARTVASARFAMQQGARRGLSTLAFHSVEMEISFRDRAGMEVEMRDGLARGEFMPSYRPIADSGSGRITGFECLAQWEHPRRGLVLPAEFIVVAEQSGMIRELNLGLLRRACVHARFWPAHLTLSFALSPLQLDDPWLADRIVQILAAACVAPGRLMVEIAEPALIDRIETAPAILSSLAAAGVRIAHDALAEKPLGVLAAQSLAHSAAAPHSAVIDELAARRLRG